MFVCVLLAAMWGQIPGNVLVYPPGDVPGNVSIYPASRQQPSNRQAGFKETATITERPAKVSIIGAKAVFLEVNDIHDQPTEKREFLQVTVKVENLDARNSLAYFSWGKLTKTQYPATAMTGTGLPLRIPTKIAGPEVKGRRDKELIGPKQSLTDILVFEMPNYADDKVYIRFTANHLLVDPGTNSVFGYDFELTITRQMWFKSLGAVAVTKHRQAETVSQSTDDAKITVIGASIRKTNIETATDAYETTANMLLITLRIENLSDTTALEYAGDLQNSDRVVAVTNEGSSLHAPNLKFGHRVLGASPAVEIKPQRHIDTVVMIQPPSRTTKTIELRIKEDIVRVATDAVGGRKQPFILNLSSAFWSDYFRKDDEARNKAVEKMKPKKKSD